MGNFKKISAAVVAGAIMLSSVVPTFAAAYTPLNGEKASVLNQLELYAGTSDTSFVPSLETSLTRGQGATLLAKLFNMDTAAQALTDEEANAILKDFADADKVPTYAKKRLAYLVKNNIMSGSKDTATGDVFVNADEALLGGQFATLILKQLGYTVASWSEAVNQLSKVDGAKEIADYLAYAQKSLLRDQAVGVMFGSLTSEYSDGKATIIDKIVEAKPSLRAIAQNAGLIAAPAVLAVDSVKALNLRQIQVVFNKTVDKSIEKAEYFNAFNNGSTADLVNGGSVSLQADGKTAIVTMGQSFNNGTVAKVVVKTIATYVNDSVAVADITVPTVAGVTVTGPQTITVEYSEPIKGINNAEYTIDNGNYIVTNAVANGSNKVDVTVGVNLTNGEHSLKINGTNVSDYADYKVISRTISFTVAADTTAPVATVKSVSPKEVKVTFNKPVINANKANVLYRHTYNSNLYEIAGSDNTKVTVNSTTEITIDWSAMPIPLGANKLYIAYGSDTGDKIQDLWGNKLEALSLDLSVAMDTVKPTVTEVKFVDASTLKVIFSKKVEEASAETALNFIVKDSAGKVVTINTPELGGTDANEVTIKTTTANALGGGSYTVEVKNVKDTALVQNIMNAYSATLNINDTVRPTLGTAKYLLASTKATVYIPFSEVMDAASLVKANFMKVVTVGADVTTAALGDNDTLTVAADKKSVTIVIDNGATAINDINVVVGAVRDAAGNGLAAFAANADPEADAIAIEKVEAIAKKQIKVTYDGRLSAVTAAGYSLIANGTDTLINLSVAGHTVNSEGKSEVIFNLGTELSADATTTNGAVSLVASSAAGTKSFLGTELSNNAGKQADDKITASIVSVTVVNGTIEVKFDEAIKADTLATATLNGFSVTGGDAKLTTVALKGGDATTIVLTGTGLVANQTSVTYNSAAGIADNGSNLIASFTQIAK